MRQELDAQLCEKYPLMMVNRNKDMKETCMCWGFECGDGWFNILDQLMGSIQHHIDWKNKKEQVVPQVTLDQVKEKFGTLRFYYSGGDEYIHGLVSMAESMSAVTCETCGKPGAQQRGGWIRTLCEEHAKPKQITDYQFIEEDDGHHD
jgi:hypothetical protein